MFRCDVFVFFLVLGLIGACSSFEGDSTPNHDVTDAGSQNDATQNPTDARTADIDAAEAAAPLPGAAMVMITTDAGSFYVDETEATVAEWQATVAATDWASPALQSALPSACRGEGKKGWTDRIPASCALPNTTQLTTAPEVPVNCVDWCDAFAFCLAHGKRLCGKSGGGAMINAQGAKLEAEAISAASEWTLACGGESLQPFPYGASVEASKCNQDSPAPTPAGQYPDCHGPIEGLLEMMGNLNEWENACTSNAENGQCTARGGAYRSGTDSSGCLATHNGQLPVRLQAYDDVGIRCCADVPR